MTRGPGASYFARHLSRELKLFVKPAPRPHDHAGLDALLSELLPAVAAGVRGRRVAFCRYHTGQERLRSRWTSDGKGVERGEVNLEPARLHPLLGDDAQRSRPFRPAEDAARWAVDDLFPGGRPRRSRLWARAVSSEGEWIGVLLVLEPRGWLGRARKRELEAQGDRVELAVSRTTLLSRIEEDRREHRQALEALLRKSEQRFRELKGVAKEPSSSTEVAAGPRLDALELAAGRATELLAEAHVELDRRSERLKRQTRLLFLLRRFLAKHLEGLPPRELAADLVNLVSEAFYGSRCSLLLLDPLAGRAGDLRVAAALGLPPALDPASIRVRPGAGISGWVARTLSPVVVRDSEEAGQYPLVADEAYQGAAFASFPLSCHGRFQGVLNLTNFEGGTFDDAELEQLRLVSLCVALVVDHARLSERLFAVESAAP